MIDFFAMPTKEYNSFLKRARECTLQGMPFDGVLYYVIGLMPEVEAAFRNDEPLKEEKLAELKAEYAKNEEAFLKGYDAYYSKYVHENEAFKSHLLTYFSNTAQDADRFIHYDETTFNEQACEEKVERAMSQFY